jgi:hypothetical protein
MPKTNHTLTVILEIIKEFELIYNLSPNLTEKQKQILAKKVSAILNR